MSSGRRRGRPRPAGLPARVPARRSWPGCRAPTAGGQRAGLRVGRRAEGTRQLGDWGTQTGERVKGRSYPLWNDLLSRAAHARRPRIASLGRSDSSGHSAGSCACRFVAVDGGGHLAVSGLNPLPRGRSYQLWFVPTGSPAVTGAIFGVNARGLAWVKVTVPSSLDDVHAIVVTEEPASGSATPTGIHVLDARPWC